PNTASTSTTPSSNSRPADHGSPQSADLISYAAYTECSRDYGFSPQQGQLLCVLRPQPLGMGELGAVLGLAKSSVTGLVDRLERHGLVRREPDQQDSRMVRAVLTVEGRDVADRFFEQTSARIEQLPVTLTAEEREVLAGLLGRVTDANNVSAIFMDC
ncbi:MarR family transcriptional regulator, partial [Actinoplanes sp. NPDC026619]|uniref:MarR family winged helix-turn-helix transcriptional regulator n=1 Tax=Actinoplanes sp. NPDC026619 TaxID=3155798 RepID=UPI00340B8793